MFHIYTFGKASKQFLILTRRQAETINKFHDIFSASQKLYMEKNGKHWNPSEPLTFVYKESEKHFMSRYNKVADFCNTQHKIRNFIFDILRVNVSAEELDDYLVKRF